MTMILMEFDRFESTCIHLNVPKRTESDEKVRLEEFLHEL